jgi:hypothetical protein
MYSMPRNRRSANGKLEVQVSTFSDTVSQIESEPLQVNLLQVNYRSMLQRLSFECPGKLSHSGPLSPEPGR